MVLNPILRDISLHKYESPLLTHLSIGDLFVDSTESDVGQDAREVQEEYSRYHLAQSVLSDNACIGKPLITNALPRICRNKTGLTVHVIGPVERDTPL